MTESIRGDELSSSFRGSSKERPPGSQRPLTLLETGVAASFMRSPLFSFSLCRRHMAAALPKAVHYRPPKCLWDGGFTCPRRPLAYALISVYIAFNGPPSFRAKEVIRFPMFSSSHAATSSSGTRGDLYLLNTQIASVCYILKELGTKEVQICRRVGNGMTCPSPGYD